MNLTPLKEARARAECDAIKLALKQEKGNKTAAAKYLGIDRKTLFKKLKKYGIYTEPDRRNNFKQLK